MFSKDLTIVVPTFNRAQILKSWLEHHARLMLSKKIRIHIQDNCSTDGTKALLKKWKKKFNNISFEINKKNYLTKNLVLSLNKGDSRFIWQIGDTYVISEHLLNRVLFNIRSHSPLFLIVNLHEKIKHLKESYIEADFVCEKLSGILSCISCIIYNRSKLGTIKFKKKPFSYFPHTIYVLNKLKFYKSQAYWIPFSVSTLPISYQLKKSWASDSRYVFEVGCKNWIISINSLIKYNYKSKKKAFKLYNEATNLFNWKGGLRLRAQGLLTINKIRTYKIYLNKSVGKSYLLLYLIALIPIYPLKILKKIYDQCLKK
jgi:abequosyltransferase